MNCEQSQEMLLSDYHDGRLSAHQRREIDQHLTVCPACKLLSERIYDQTIKPFNQTEHAMPDDFCWSQIKRRIAQVPAPAPKPFWLLRPALVFSSLCVMLMIGGVIFKQYTISQTPSIAYMLSSDTDTNDEVSASIEEYFL